MMKVLFVSSGNKGAVSPIIKNQGDALADAGVEMDYFLIRGKGVRGYLRNIRPLKQYIKEHHYDAVHAHYSLTAFVASLAGIQLLVVSLMGSDVKASRYYKFIIRIFARLFHWKTIIVKSKDMYHDLGIKTAMIIPNGVNMNRFHPMDKKECQERLGWNERKKHILFPANATRPEKDYELAKAVVEHMANVEIHSYNNTPNAETPYWYNAADVVLMTSKWEGSPNAIKEAMACGCPIVSVDVGDVQERLEGIDGCYVAKTREPQEIAGLVARAIRFKGRTTGRERIIESGLDNRQIARRLIEIYKNVLHVADTDRI